MLYRARRMFGCLAGPATEPCDMPGSPSESVLGVGIFLFVGSAFETLGQGVKGSDLVGAEDARSRQAAAGFSARVHELHDHGGSDQRGSGETFECVGVFQEARFDVEGLRFQGPEQLLDGPASTVEFRPRRVW